MFVVVFQGGFANQIFQYAFYLHLIEKFSSDNVFADISHYKKCKDHGGFKLRRFVNLHYINRKRIKNLITINENNYEQTIFSDEANYYFNGYWQEEKFFPRDIQKIKDIFNIDNLNSKNKVILKSIINTDSVSVHVRRGDYVNNFMHGNIANQCYLQNSIDYVKSAIENPYFFVFSDDIEWAQNNLKFPNPNVIFVSGNSDKVEQDIILMSNCKHNIISNSSFSWWAQFLNSNPEKIVITPEYWFNQKLETAKELLVDNSIRIPNTPFVKKELQQPFFSILIPVYNTEKTLRRTLASVLNQTYESIEVIIVDDGSTDNSLEILKTYESRDARIKLVKHEKNLGLLAARYTAMEKATGKYVLFIDSDDWLELYACQILYSELQKNPVDVLEFGFIREPLGIKQVICKDYGDRADALLQRNYLSTFWNKVYSINVVKKVLTSVKPFSCTFSEDMFYSLVFTCFAKTFGYIDYYLTHYMLFTGISTQKIYSTEQIKKIINDALNVKNQSELFLAQNFPEKLQYHEQYTKRNCNNISYMISQNSDLAVVLEQLKILDTMLGTSYYESKIKQISGIISKYETVLTLPFIKICLSVFMFLISIFKNRIQIILKDLLKK